MVTLNISVFRLFQSVAAALGFVYSLHLLLQWQLLIMVVFGTAGTLAFFLVEWSQSQAQYLGYSPISDVVTDVSETDVSD